MDSLVLSAWRTLRAVAPILPQRKMLGQEVSEAIAAQERGYYLPDEDERVRETYTRYLGVRTSLWETVHTLRPLLDERRNPDWDLRLKVFGLAFCAAAMLVRSAGFIVSLAKDRPVVWKKLDEAEPRYGLEERSFTQIYRSLSSARWMWRYYESWRFYDTNRQEIAQVLQDAEMHEISDWLAAEEPHFEKKRREFIKRKIRYRLHSFKRRQVSGYKRVMFHLFRLSGSAIAEMRQPFVKRGHIGKRVSESIRESVDEMLRPGDVIVTRHDDAMSNLFLPGYWPHAALYLGGPKKRNQLSLPSIDRDEVNVLEAKKDGVLFRHLQETLSVDSFVVLRPRIAKDHLKDALTRAMSHEGKLYDFVFDFRKADRLVCTEVVYRAYQGVGPVQFELTKRSGRLALSAEDLLRQALDSGHFEVLLCFGVEEDVLRVGDSARKRLLASLRKFGA